MQLACGITNKPKEPIMDIDAADVKNELAAVEYIEDMYKFYKLAEVIVNWFSLSCLNSSCLVFILLCANFFLCRMKTGLTIT